jgi:hypothetical protein
MKMKINGERVLATEVERHETDAAEWNSEAVVEKEGE